MITVCRARTCKLYIRGESLVAVIICLAVKRIKPHYFSFPFPAFLRAPMSIGITITLVTSAEQLHLSRVVELISNSLKGDSVAIAPPAHISMVSNGPPDNPPWRNLSKIYRIPTSVLHLLVSWYDSSINQIQRLVSLGLMITDLESPVRFRRGSHQSIR